MAKLCLITVTKHFRDGRTEVIPHVQIRSSLVTQPWFEIDGSFYYMPRDHEGVFKSSGKPYYELTVVRE
jgi:hypothetical protein